jgi:hypothetical protein
MCDELGEQAFMDAYIMEAGSVSLCRFDANFEGCSEKEIIYAQKWLAKPKEAVTTEIERLISVTAQMKGAGNQQIIKNLAMLKQIQKKLLVERVEL